MKYIKLSGSGQLMPIIGLGTWQATAEEIENAVITALKLGYRHIDTAFNYNNEDAIGNVLRRWFDSGNGKREDLFVTTKLPHIGNRPKDVSRFLQMSLNRLKLSYVDLYLVHMPFGFICDEETLTPKINSAGFFELDNSTDHIATWKVLEEQVKLGLAKNIGLSNFNSRQIQNVYDNSIIKPSVLQVELHAYLQQKDLRRFCDKLNIAITAYSPLGSPGAKNHFQNKYDYSIEDFPDILGLPTVSQLSEKYGKTKGQILLKHLISQNVIIIPKSANVDRIKNNLTLFDFEISEEDLELLNNLEQGEQGRIFNFLFFKGVDKHPQYPFN